MAIFIIFDLKYLKLFSKAVQLLTKIHFDVWGPYQRQIRFPIKYW